MGGWEKRRSGYDLYISEFVVSEAGAGDEAMAARRLRELEGIAEIELGPDALQLAERLVDKGPLPENAAVDALHIAAAVSGGIDYLLTWNFKHLANVVIRTKIEKFIRSLGYEPCVICTPEELPED